MLMRELVPAGVGALDGAALTGAGVMCGVGALGDWKYGPGGACWG